MQCIPQRLKKHIETCGSDILKKSRNSFILQNPALFLKQHGKKQKKIKSSIATFQRGEHQKFKKSFIIFRQLMFSLTKELGDELLNGVYKEAETGLSRRHI